MKSSIIKAVTQTQFETSVTAFISLQTKVGNLVGLEFEIISKLDSYFLMTVIELELLHNYPQNYSKP